MDNAVFSLENAGNIAQLAAISKNLIYSKISIKDGIYGVLSEKDIRNQIETISNLARMENENNENEIIFYLKKLSDLIEKKTKLIKIK